MRRRRRQAAESTCVRVSQSHHQIRNGFVNQVRSVRRRSPLSAAVRLLLRLRSQVMGRTSHQSRRGRGRRSGGAPTPPQGSRAGTTRRRGVVGERERKERSLARRSDDKQHDFGAVAVLAALTGVAAGVADPPLEIPKSASPQSTWSHKGLGRQRGTAGSPCRRAAPRRVHLSASH